MTRNYDFIATSLSGIPSEKGCRLTYSNVLFTDCKIKSSIVYLLIIPHLTLRNVSSVQFTHSSRVGLWDPMDCSTPGLPVHHQLPQLTQTHVHRVNDAISSSVIPFSSCLQSFPGSGSFPMSQLFASGGKSIGVSASASFLPMNIQD